ncbi:hypothetical protein GOBAR_DD18765 [Gossypium barbadense]|nr:hypothetical protein GOBAR_DD18765 [Gossypium barbadense]
MFLSSIHAPRHFNLNHDDDEELDDQTSTLNTLNPKPNPPENHQLGHETEPMFEKPLTPSDVGKLNRLVYPQTTCREILPARRSQSYVLTKGWSRYVKEKQLDAGDIILFQRHRTDGDRLFIGWRRRGAAVVVVPAATDGGNAVMENDSGGGGGGNGGWSNRGLYQRYPHLGHIQGDLEANVPYQPDCLHAGSIVQNQATAAGNPKRLVRLFGVNLECHQLDESPPSTPASSMMNKALIKEGRPLSTSGMDIVPRHEADEKDEGGIRSEDVTSRN